MQVMDHLNIYQDTEVKVTKIITQTMRQRLLLMMMSGHCRHKQNLHFLLLWWLAQVSNLHKGEDYKVQRNCHALVAYIMNAILTNISHICNRF
jgi:hypothetical protein